jgi:ATP-binding cassette, subfamily B, bacterial
VQRTDFDHAEHVMAFQQAPPYLVRPGQFIQHYLLSWRGHFAALAAMVIMAAACAVAVQYQMKLLVDAMAGTAQQAIGVWMALFFFIGLIAIESVLWRASGWLACRTTIGVGVEIRLDLFDYLSGQSIRYFADNLAGSLGQRVTATAGTFGALINTAVWRIAPPMVDFLGALVIFVLIDWRMAAAMAIYVIAMTVVLIIVGIRGRRLHSQYAGRSSEVAGELMDVISNMWAVKAFSAREREWQRLKREFEQEATLQRSSWMYTERTRVFYDIVLWFMATAMLSWAVYSWTRGSITPGDVVVVSALTFRILHGSRDVALSVMDVVQQFGYIEDTLGVIGRVHGVVDPPHAPSLVRRHGSVRFRNVSFAYEPGRPALRNVDFAIRAGEKVGIAGPSGAGKTTIVQLIQRLYDVQLGDIVIDDQSIRSVSQDSLRDTLSVVPQEITLFHRTVMDNIRFGRPGASDAEVVSAARAAHCEAFISKLPQGYDTRVGERGVKLSGGQRQRIGIARAFLKDAPIIILDEATSALDTESEMTIQRNIIELLGHRTVIAVAHRLSTLAAFDRILVIDQGRIVEEGTPAELRSRAGLFERMWRMQAEGLDSEAAADSMQQRRERAQG